MSFQQVLHPLRTNVLVAWNRNCLVTETGKRCIVEDCCLGGFHLDPPPSPALLISASVAQLDCRIQLQWKSSSFVDIRICTKLITLGPTATSHRIWMWMDQLKIQARTCKLVCGTMLCLLTLGEETEKYRRQILRNLSNTGRALCLKNFTLVTDWSDVLADKFCRFQNLTTSDRRLASEVLTKLQSRWEQSRRVWNPVCPI